jgi:ferredoxin--NADP+ reductase
MTVKDPRFSVDGLSYEAFNPDTNQAMERVFLAGWARQASTGLVGYARRDGENASEAILAYLHTQPQMRDLDNVVDKFKERLSETHEHLVDKVHLARLESAELAEAQKEGLEEYKYPTNDAMFTAMGY